MDSSASPMLMIEKFSSSACRTNLFSGSEVRFSPESGDHIDLQVAHAISWARWTQVGTKYLIFREIIFFMKNPKFSALAKYLLMI